LATSHNTEVPFFLILHFWAELRIKWKREALLGECVESPKFALMAQTAVAAADLAAGAAAAVLRGEQHLIKLFRSLLSKVTAVSDPNLV